MSANDLNHQLEAMTAELRSAGDVFTASRFWEWLSACNTEQLVRAGFANFKRTVNQNYYNWIPTTFSDNQTRRLLDYWAANPKLTPLQVELEPPDALEGFFSGNPFSSPDYCRFYPFFVGMLWQHAVEHDATGIAAALEEPATGNPIRTKLNGTPISQDLANSLREFNSVRSLSPGSGAATKVVAELGAGYGRLAQPFLKFGGCRYLIFDIPPALALSQWYIAETFPEKRIFSFRHFERFDDVAEEVARADVAFFSANQLSLIPDGYVNDFISISSLHEMTHRQISYYLDQISRVTSRSVYFKQWKKWHNQADGIFVESSDYVLPGPWKLAVDRPDAIQDLFQEQGFTL